jgi:uncharacterized membrane protein
MNVPVSSDRVALVRAALTFGIAALILAILGMPFGYYALLSVFICILSLYVAWEIRRADAISALIFLFVGLAVLYNPILPLRLGRSLWIFVNIITIGIYIYTIVRLRSDRSSPPT